MRTIVDDEQLLPQQLCFDKEPLIGESLNIKNPINDQPCHAGHPPQGIKPIIKIYDPRYAIGLREHFFPGTRWNETRRLAYIDGVQCGVFESIGHRLQDDSSFPDQLHEWANTPKDQRPEHFQLPDSVEEAVLFWIENQMGLSDHEVAIKAKPLEDLDDSPVPRCFGSFKTIPWYTGLEPSLWKYFQYRASLFEFVPGHLMTPSPTKQGTSSTSLGQSAIQTGGCSAKTCSEKDFDVLLSSLLRAVSLWHEIGLGQADIHGTNVIVRENHTCVFIDYGRVIQYPYGQGSRDMESRFTELLVVHFGLQLNILEQLRPRFTNRFHAIACNTTDTQAWRSVMNSVFNLHDPEQALQRIGYSMVVGRAAAQLLSLARKKWRRYDWPLFAIQSVCGILDTAGVAIRRDPYARYSRQEASFTLNYHLECDIDLTSFEEEIQRSLDREIVAWTSMDTVPSFRETATTTTISNLPYGNISTPDKSDTSQSNAPVSSSLPYKATCLNGDLELCLGGVMAAAYEDSAPMLKGSRDTSSYQPDSGLLSLGYVQSSQACGLDLDTVDGKLIPDAKSHLAWISPT